MLAVVEPESMHLVRLLAQEELAVEQMAAKTLTALARLPI